MRPCAPVLVLVLASMFATSCAQWHEHRRALSEADIRLDADGKRVVEAYQREMTPTPEELELLEALRTLTPVESAEFRADLEAILDER